MLRVKFKDKAFLVSTETSTQPNWAQETFELEAPLRDKWWNIEPRDIVLDVGAAYGSYTLPAIASGAALVVAFEPNPESYYDLCMNLNINSFMPKCIPLNFMADKVPKLTQKTYFPDTHSSVKGKYPTLGFAVSIDEIVEKYKLPRVDWIKIDVEGSEFDVLVGAAKTITEFHPTLLVENHIGYNLKVEDDIRSLLRPIGYVEQDAEMSTGVNDRWSLWNFVAH